MTYWVCHPSDIMKKPCSRRFCLDSATCLYENNNNNTVGAKKALRKVPAAKAQHFLQFFPTNLLSNPTGPWIMCQGGCCFTE